MMKGKFTFLNYFLFTIFVLLSSCVPKVTEKKALCGTNEQFNNVTRTCYSILETRYVPVANKTSETIDQEQAKTITLSYTDGNSDLATSCRVSNVSNNLVAMSPVLFNNSLYDKANVLVATATSLANALTVEPDRTTAQGYLNDIISTVALAKKTINYEILQTQIALVEGITNNLLNLAAPYTIDNSTIDSRYTDLSNSADSFVVQKIFLNNKCDCVGGTCTTILTSKRFQSGLGNFSYTITDRDGASESRVVAVNVNPMASAAIANNAFLNPVIPSQNVVVGAESSNNFASAYSFTIPDGKDLFSTPASSFSYSFNPKGGTKTIKQGSVSNFGVIHYVDSDKDNSGVSKGKITHCLGIDSDLSDRVCDYIPNDGEAFDVTTPAKANVSIGGLAFTAKAEGVTGNSIKIFYKDISSTDPSTIDPLSTERQKFAYTTSPSEVYVRVNGNNIYVFLHSLVSTSQQVQDALTSDPLASALVAVSGGSASVADVAAASSGVSLAGGVDGYDSFSYSVLNAYGQSTNTAKVIFKINSTTDYPNWLHYPSYTSPLVALTDSSTILEGGSTITLTTPVSGLFSDVDNIANTCDVSLSAVDLTAALNAGLTGVTAPEVNKASSDLGVQPPSISTPTCAIVPSGLTKNVVFTIPRDTAIKMHTFGSYALLFKISDGAALATSNPVFHAIRFTIKPVNDRPDMPTISWTTSSTNPVTSSSGASWSVTSRENSTSSPSTGYADITINSDVSATGFETAQTLSLTATSDNQALLNDSKITITNQSSTVKRITFVTEKNKSGSANITVTLKDNGGVLDGGVDTYVKTIALTVTMVDDPPFFINSITKVETNEGGMIQTDAFLVDEDQGSTADEDTQNIKITSIVSDNPAVLPAPPTSTTAITAFYDLNDNGVEDVGEKRALNECFEDKTCAANTLDSSLHKFYLKLKPIAGVSGNANVTVTVSDGTNTTSTTFSLIVHPIAALHGGWSNISALGVKTDKNGAPASTDDLVCNYNKSTDINNCSGADCLGSQSPHSVIIPSAANVIYWDQSSKRCYRSQGANDKFSWIEMATTCPITRITVANTALTSSLSQSELSSISVTSTAGYPASGKIIIDTETISYSAKTATTFTTLTRATPVPHNSQAVVKYAENGNNFIYDSSLLPAQSIPTATAVNQYYYNPLAKTCKISSETSPGVWGWSTGNFTPSKVTLTWNAFTLNGSGPDSGVQILAWNVYRRESGQDYDFKTGALKNKSSDVYSISSPSIRTFTDKTAIAGKVYFYTVRPVDNINNTSTSFKFSTFTPDIISEVRVIAPVENYAFVHRWMVNQEICNSMHITTTASTTTGSKVDPTHNYRCNYNGLGESTTTPGYYDIGKDMLVDISESGCPYSPSPKCSDDGCIGIGAPTSTANLTGNEIYYDRSSGSCYAYQTGVWTAMNSATLSTSLIAKMNSALNAPLVNVSVAKSSSICTTRDITSATSSLTGAIAAKLPTKAEYIAYASSPTGKSDAELTDLEQGYSLNIQSRCNSSSANGLETAFSDSSVPSSKFSYTISGTASSSIRSIYTGSVSLGSNGSYSTETCSSRYGIQDVYGNVSEWVKDTMTCNANNFTCTADAGTELGNYNFGGGTKYGFNYVTGPYNDANADSAVGAGDSFLTAWSLRDELFGAGKFSFPVGMPMYTDISLTSVGSSAAIPYLLDIGPTSGITTNQLHEDGIVLNTLNIADGQQGAFAVGGSYLSGNQSGRFYTEMVPIAISTRSDIGMRCIIPVTPANYNADSAHTYPY